MHSAHVVDVEQVAGVFLRHFRGAAAFWLCQRPAGIVDQDVEAAELIDGLLHGQLADLLVPDVAGNRDRPAPFLLDDLLRLTALESWRHRALVIGEDLGTVPTGFRERLAQTGIDGMRVLWFEQEDGHFRQPDDWDRSAVAMTTTHDLPTVAGWWRGADIETRAALGILGEPTERARRTRRKERAALWRAFRAAGVASGRQPAAQAPERAIDGALGFIARTPAPLALVPLEDALAVPDQPNMPGTIDEHPNWRRRTPLPVDVLLEEPDVTQRLATIERQRRS